MRLLRLQLTGPPLLYEVHSQLGKNVAENNSYVEKTTPGPSKFIQNSSSTGNKAGIRETKVTRRDWPSATTIPLGVLHGARIQDMLYS
jgi:hypothetical protein